jgi:hypothetical protein
LKNKLKNKEKKREKTEKKVLKNQPQIPKAKKLESPA